MWTRSSAAAGAHEAIAANGKLAALAFKTVADPYIGRMTFVRVFSGTLNADSHVWNSAKARDERITQVTFVRGKTTEATPESVKHSLRQSLVEISPTSAVPARALSASP